MAKVTATIAKAEYAEKMIKFQHDKAKTQAKKEILTTTQNVQLNTSKKSAAPEEEIKKPLTPHERMAKFAQSGKQVGQL